MTIVFLADLIVQISDIAQHAETVRETGRHVDLADAIVSKFSPKPVSIRCRPTPQVDCNIKDATTHDRHYLRLRPIDLEMQPTQHPSRGAGMIVLHKIVGDTAITI